MTAEAAAARSRAVTVGTLGYLLASVLWGLNIPLTVELLRHFDPFWVSPPRYAIASLALGLIVAVTLGPARLRSPIALPRLAAMGLGVALFLVFYNLGLRYSDALTAAAVTAGSPVYVAVVSRMMTGARLERGFWGATLLTLVGTAIAIWGRARAGGSELHLQGGEPLLVLAIASWTAYSIVAQRWFTADTPQLRRTFLSSVAAIPWLLLFWTAARLAGLAGEPNLHPGAQALVTLVVGAVFCTALATVAWNNGVGRLGIGTGALWQNTVPVFAVIISLVFFGVVPLLEQVVGGAVVLSGVLYMQWQRLRRPH